jgi:tetrahydromethanopterin S-methyltransferase subunit A
MGASESTETGALGNIERAASMLRAAADARKCWACGCLRHALDAIDHAQPAPGYNDALNMALGSARERLRPQRYECFGCDTCFPAVALNDLAADGSVNLAEAAACPADAAEER